MFANFLAQHAPYIPGYEPVVPSPPPPAPAPPPSPNPPQPEPIAFSVVTRASLFGIVGSAISSTTLATVTCADDAMALSVAPAVPGLTFTYAAKVLSVAGTPTTPTGIYRVVASYISSDGAATVRGSSEHEITIVSASEVLTIGDMAGATGRVGRILAPTTLAVLSSNFAVDLTASRVGATFSYTSLLGVVFPLTTLDWTKGASSGSGQYSLNAVIPQEAGTFTLTVTYTGFGQTLGTSTHEIVISESYQLPAPAPAPVPAPPPPAPSPPPAPTPAPAPGAGPDPHFAQVKVLMHFDSATGIATDVKGNTFTNTGATLATGAVGEAANFSSASTKMEGRIAGIDGADGTLTVEAVVNLSAAGWTAMTGGSLKDVRFCPVATLIDDDENVVWSLGFMSSQNLTGPAGRYVVGAFYNGLTGFQFGNPAGSNSASSYAYQELATNPGRFLHLCGCRRRNPVNPSDGNYDQGTWLDGKGGGVRIIPSLSLLRTAATGTLRIGGVTPAMEYANANVGTRRVTLVPFSGQIDELRITTFARHSALMVNQQVLAIDPYRRVIPWPNY